MFPLLTPVAFGIFESTKQYRDSFNLIAWMEERAFKSFRRLGKSLGIIIRLASLFCYVLALFLLTVTLSPVYGKESWECPPGGGVLSLVIVICVVLISIPFWINYALGNPIGQNLCGYFTTYASVFTLRNLIYLYHSYNISNIVIV